MHLPNMLSGHPHTTCGRPRHAARHTSQFHQQPHCRKRKPLTRPIQAQRNAQGVEQQQPKQQQQQQQTQQQQQGLDADKRRAMEDELRDPSNFVGYLAPRPLRLVFFGFSAVSCLVGSLIAAGSLLQDASLSVPPEASGLQNLLINLLGAALFGGLFITDSRGVEQRLQQRKAIREAQIKAGDREVFVNEQGETMSRLKEVNDDWILRRLEKWGRRENMPFLGPRKAAILQQLVQQQQPRLAVEVGSMAGYSAIVIAQVLPPGSRLVSIEKDISWWLVAKRFLWQASQGEKNQQRDEPLGRKVDLWLGDAIAKLPIVSAAKGGAAIDLLLLDGLPKETLAYLKAAEPCLAPRALIIADNAGVFAEGGMKDYLEYVRSSSSYSSSRFIESTFEWRDDVPDGLEVSVYNPQVVTQGPTPSL